MHNACAQRRGTTLVAGALRDCRRTTVQVCSGVGGQVAETTETPVDGVTEGVEPPSRLSVPLVVGIFVVLAVIGLAAVPFVELFPAAPPPPAVELGPVSVGASIGPPLRPVAGEWMVDEQGVGATALTPLGFPAQFVADLGSADGWLAVRASVVSGGWGVVFRQRSAGDYLWVLAAPAFAALKVGRTDAGIATDIGTVAPVGVRDGMVLTVAFEGQDIRLRIDGREVGSFTDAGAAPGTGVGLLGAERALGVGRWANFRAGMLPAPSGRGGDGG